MARAPGAERLRRNRRLRVLLRRAGVESYVPRLTVPPRPIGAKLELTHACNLRCGFCYTDSPRHTLARTPDLSDADWEGIVDELIGLGTLEVVLTGGEALLRRDLTLGLIDRLTSCGLSTTLVTNGWFVDDVVAGRIAGAGPLLSVNVSLDGPTPEAHDRARGLPGSWRRAVGAIDRLVARDVYVRVIHVVTPDNETLLAETIERVAELGVVSLRVTPVIPLGAAARGQSDTADLGRMKRTIASAQRRHGSALSVRLVRDEFAGAPVQAPVSVLVRPNGGVMTGGVGPFRFGDAVDDGITECWGRIRRDWQAPRVTAYGERVLDGAQLGSMPRVMYRDAELDLYAAGSPGPLDPSRSRPGVVTPVALPAPVPRTQQPGDGDLVAAARHIRELVLSRPLRLGDVRWAESGGGGRYVRTAAGGVSLVNASAATVMDACAGATPRAAVAALRARHPTEPVARLEDDTLIAVRDLLRRGALVQDASSSRPRSSSASTVAVASSHAALDPSP